MNNALPTLSVVMPCLNEEKNVGAAIETTLAAFDKYGISGEIIVINDGSVDKTPDVVRAAMEKDGRVRMIEHDRPHGLGGSFWHGAMEAKCDYVTMIPGDNENDPEDALTYFYLAQDVDIIVPFIVNITVRSIFRRFLSRLFRAIVNLSFGMNLNYMNGNVIYNRRILSVVSLNSRGFFYQAEILVKLVRAGYLYAETPHFLSVRGSGKSKAVSIKSTKEVMKSFLSLLWKIHVLHSPDVTNLPIVDGSMTKLRRAMFDSRQHGA